MSGDQNTNLTEKLTHSMNEYSEPQVKLESNVPQDDLRLCDKISEASNIGNIEHSPFDGLPNEMLIAVFDKLGIHGKKQARLTCRRWCSVLDNPEGRYFVFKPWIYNSQHSFEVLQKTKFSIWDSLQVHNLLQPILLNRSCPTTVKKILIGRNNSESNLIEILEFGLANLENLEIYFEEAFLNIRREVLLRILSKNQWSRLTTLKIQIPQSSLCFGNLQTFLSLAQAPRITNLFIDFRSGNDDDGSYQYREGYTRFIEVMCQIYQLVVHHASILKNINIRAARHYRDTARSSISLLNQANWSGRREQVLVIERELKLTSFEIVLESDFANLYLLRPIITSKNSLLSLRWICNYFDEDDDYESDSDDEDGFNVPTEAELEIRNTLLKIMTMNQETLTSVAIVLPHQFDMRCLQGCTALKELSLQVSAITNQEFQMQNLTSLEINWPHKIGYLYKFIVESFPNLKVCRLTSFINRANYAGLELLFSSLRKLRLLSFLEDPFDLPHDLQLPHWIPAFCKDHKLRFSVKSVKNENWRRFTWRQETGFLNAGQTQVIITK